MYIRHILTVALTFWLSISTFGNQRIDSLKNELDKCDSDTTRLILYKKLGKAYTSEGQFDLGLRFHQSALSLSDSLITNGLYLKFAKVARFDAYKYIGLNIEQSDSFDRAPSYYFEALKFSIQDNLLDKQCAILGTIGMYYYTVGDYPSSLDFSLRQLELAKKINDEYQVANSHNRIGINYKRQFMHEQALENLFLSVELFNDINKLNEVANGWNNIGNVYFNMQNYRLAYEYYQKQLNIGIRIEDDELVADANNCKAQVFNEVAFYSLDTLADYFGYTADELKTRKVGFLLDSAIYYFNLAIVYYEGEKEYYELSDCYHGLGQTFTLQSNYSKAIEAFTTSYNLAKSSGVLQKEMAAANGLYINFKKQNNHQAALNWYEVYNLLQDSVFSDSKSRELGRLESRHDFEVKEAELLAEQNHDRILANAEKQTQRTIILVVTISLILVFILLVFLFSRFRLIKSQKRTIEDHKSEIETKQKEIVDSINYAKRLQHAILAREEEIQKFFPNSFLLYKPKDIVAGDFYFFEKTDSHVFYAAADCTGHGVPGAMVSIVCANALTRSIKEFGLTDPGEILDKTKELVVETFEKSGADVKDGMDISFIAKDLKTNEIKWAGAHNSLWIIENDLLREIKPDKQHIGKSYLDGNFTSQVLSLSKNAILYLFTDGYADQFGGDKGKKFKSSNMKNLLLSLGTKSMREQKNGLDHAFETWRGSLEQLDDVCIIGVRI